MLYPKNWSILHILCVDCALQTYREFSVHLKNHHTNGLLVLGAFSAACGFSVASEHRTSYVYSVRSHGYLTARFGGQARQCHVLAVTGLLLFGSVAERFGLSFMCYRYHTNCLLRFAHGRPPIVNQMKPMHRPHGL